MDPPVSNRMVRVYCAFRAQAMVTLFQVRKFTHNYGKVGHVRSTGISLALATTDGKVGHVRSTGISLALATTETECFATKNLVAINQVNNKIICYYKCDQFVCSYIIKML